MEQSAPLMMNPRIPLQGGSGLPSGRRGYKCTFCLREFRNAQALGGHMNVHRRERALAKQGPGNHKLVSPEAAINPPGGELEQDVITQLLHMREEFLGSSSSSSSSPPSPKSAALNNLFTAARSAWAPPLQQQQQLACIDACTDACTDDSVDTELRLGLPI